MEFPLRGAGLAIIERLSSGGKLSPRVQVTRTIRSDQTCSRRMPTLNFSVTPVASFWTESADDRGIQGRRGEGHENEEPEKAKHLAFEINVRNKSSSRFRQCLLILPHQSGPADEADDVVGAAVHRYRKVA